MKFFNNVSLDTEKKRFYQRRVIKTRRLKLRFPRLETRRIGFSLRFQPLGNKSCPYFCTLRALRFPLSS